MNEIENLTNYYNSFINSENGWNFFVGLKDYVNYINETPSLKKSTDKLNKERKAFNYKEGRLEKEAINELLSSKNKLSKILKINNLLNIKEIDNFFEEIDKHLKKEISSSWKLSDNIDSLLFNICITVPEKNKLSLLKLFEDKNPENNNIYGNFTFSKTLNKRRDLTREIEFKRNIEIWGDWTKLSLTPKFIEAVNIYKVPFENGDGVFSYGLVNARIEYDKAKDDYKFSKIIPEYRNSATKIQTYLIRKTNENTIKPSKNSSVPNNKLSKIETITIVKDNQRNKKRIVINKNYIESFEIIESTSKYIKSLINSILDETNTLKDINDLENCKDYLNSNIGCRIYKDISGKRALYSKTKLVKFENNLASNKVLRITPNIKTDFISPDKYKKLLSKQKNRNKN